MNINSEKRRLLLATAFCYYMYFAQSVARNIYNTLTPFIVDHYGTSLTESSVFTIAENIGYVLIMYIVTVVADRIDKAWLLFGLSAVYSLMLLYMGKGPSFLFFLLSLFITGMLGRYMDTTCTAYISDLYGENRNRYMSILLILFYIGSTLAPNLNTYLIEALNRKWHISYAVAGFIMAVGSILYLLFLIFVKKPELAVKRARSNIEKKISAITLLKNRNIASLCGNYIFNSFALYFSTQLILYLSMTDPDLYTTSVRGFIATAGSVGLVVGSALYVWISKKTSADVYLRVETIITFVFSLVALLINRPVFWMISKFLSSAIGGGSFTARTVLCCEEYPEYSSSAIAVVSLTAGIASIIATPLLNMLADATSFKFAMYFSLFLSIGAWAILRFGYVPRGAKALDM